MKKILIVYVVIMSCTCHAQEKHPLELRNVNNTCSSMNIHKCFDKNIHSLLLECPFGDHNYYRLNDLTGEMIPIIIDKPLSPISFYTDDTLFLWDKSSGKYLFYSIKNSMVSEIKKPAFLSVLSVLPKKIYNRVTFNSALTECVYWDDMCVWRVSHEAEEEQPRIDTIFKAQESFPVTHVFCLSDSIYVINRYDIQTMKEVSFLLDARQKHIEVNKSDFLINDCMDDYCIAWRDGACYACQFDSNTFELKITMSISASGGLYGRLGFLSKNTIAWYTGVNLDYHIFEPVLNQQNLLNIEN